jgi:hypothetical protein
MPMNRSHRLILAALFAVLAAAGGCDEAAPEGEAVTVPSGRAVSLNDVITNVPGPEGATARFRFLAPGLTADDVATSAEDMQALCDSFALGRTSGMVPAPQQIIISMASAVVPFGEASPDVVQFFEAFSVETGACVLAPF